ncbi:hypothetical protein FDP41_009869 [Naegleria fowleri]|uniref:Uncharacterized protein n=1 Tax=Naegleria fowleri TaxID=5763 RepID=A0A6A5BA29_NAEFO|nr:uncharacterized protein FDP41_009869 [Naegleria fowleri]KAF0971646.1 hypothetical protein FDP41_009869 [Naegleria fowleri]
MAEDEQQSLIKLQASEERKQQHNKRINKYTNAKNALKKFETYSRMNDRDTIAQDIDEALNSLYRAENELNQMYEIAKGFQDNLMEERNMRSELEKENKELRDKLHQAQKHALQEVIKQLGNLSVDEETNELVLKIKKEGEKDINPVSSSEVMDNKEK